MKLNKWQQLFQELELYFTDEIFKRYLKKFNFDLIQGKSKEVILSEIAKVLLKYNISDGFMKLTNLEKRELNTSIGEKIINSLQEEYKVENKALNNIVKEVVVDQYNATNFIYGISYDIKPVSDKMIKDIIKYTIEGKNYSDRIWDNKDTLAKNMQKIVFDFLNGKHNVNEIYDIVQEKYKSNREISERLVRTEIARVQEESNELWRQQHGISYVLYCATLDSCTCGKCQELDNKSYAINEDRPKLPRHPKCRCTYLDLVSPDWRPKLRFDNESKQTIIWTDFNKWKEGR